MVVVSMTGKIEWYLDFVDTSYKPSKDELIATFYVEPAEGITIEEAAGRVASESSVGTWTTLTELPERIKKLMAKVYEINGNVIKVAYPLDLWEFGNIPQLMSGIAGNIFGMKAVKNLRLLDFEPPKEYVESYKGPQFGLEGVRKILKIEKRPITATVPKPKIGWSAKEHAQIGYEIWTGGVDLLKDDENLSSLKFNKFEDRVRESFKMRDKAEKETGERKSFLVNITAETNEMIKRAKLVADYGGEYVMIDIVTTGWAALQTMRNVCDDLKLAIHAHRAMHAAFTRNPKHGITMYVVAKVARLIGVDQIHTGTVVGKLEGPLRDVKKINDFLRSEWHHIKPIFPVSSGGLHPGLLPDVIKMFGPDLVIQVGGGVLGHPDGAKAGAKAVRDAIDAALEGIPLEEKAKSSKELKRALEKWGHLKPM
ncbi:MAG: type III ribulose-bisphosphate carboxylase [Candidatus Asgardarchaeum californiense]|nr:MAG: type III ribulose-bisphosphate carboxylase [Candidatus Asgardarchaeum californiense]